MEIDYDFALNETLRCRIKSGWDNSGKEGEYFGNVMINSQMWAIVLFDNEDDPDLFKADGLLVDQKLWKDLRSI